MAIVWVPSLMRSLTGGLEQVEARGRTIRQVIDDLERRYPGIKERLVVDGDIRPGISVVVDGLAARRGLLQPVGESSEVHFVPAISGGAGQDVSCTRSRLTSSTALHWPRI